MEYLYIFIVAFIQGGGYDYLGWNVILKERSGNKWEPLYRVIKEILDFVVTPVILVTCFHWNVNLIAAFYILKWFGWCDGFYILVWKIFHPKRNYTEEGIWWMWWTPLGMMRSDVVYNPHIANYDPNRIMCIADKYYLIKGTISLKEFYMQLGAGLIASYAVYHFELVTVIYKLILLLF